jgi:hypothetical protein
MTELSGIIDKAAGAYEMSGTKNLAKAALIELTTIRDPEHPVIVFDEDLGGEGGDFSGAGDVSIYVSLNRLATIEITLADIIKKLARPGTQLTMIPHRMLNSTSILPQFPVAFDDGLAETTQERRL